MRWVGLSLLLASAALGQEEGWETVASGALNIRTRAQPGSAVKEIWAECDMAAAVQDVQRTLMEPERFPKFMPYVKEARVIGTPDPDGAHYVYTRLALPVVSSRDYIVKVMLDEGVASDGTGVFRQRWVSVPNRTPQRANTVRLQINEGSWHVTPNADGSSHVVYKFRVDPGGWIPGPAANMGNKSGVADTLRAVETEAQRRAAQRRTQAQNGKSKE